MWRKESPIVKARGSLLSENKLFIALGLMMFKVSHQFIFCYLVKVTKNEKSAVLFVYFFFQLLKTSFN
jgi:hypothetical protein